MPKKPTKKKAAHKAVQNETVTHVEANSLPRVGIFTREVLTVLWAQKRLFGLLVMLSSALMFVLVGLTQQTQYNDLHDALGQVFANSSNAKTQEIGTLFLTVIDGTFNSTLSEGQQIYAGIVYVFVWLIAIWLLRQLIVQPKVPIRLRDGLYNAGAPLVAVLVVGLVALVQLIPVVVAGLVIAAVNTSGLLGSNALALIAVPALGISLFALSLYWLVRTIFAFVIATIQGTYPVAALRAAGELVKGQRLRLLIHLLWLLLLCAIVYVIFMLLSIALASVLAASWLPIVPVVLQFTIVLLIVFAAAYIYLLYRRMIDARA